MISITDFWEDFQRNNPQYLTIEKPQFFYFGDNKTDADDCAQLVVLKIKQATSPSLWWFTEHNEALPQIGDLSIVTDWESNPKAIIKTIKVEIAKFKDITPEYAFIEGEGDKSLAYWKKVHWEYYKNEMKEFIAFPNLEMEIVCEYFETIWTT